MKLIANEGEEKIILEDFQYLLKNYSLLKLRYALVKKTYMVYEFCINIVVIKWNANLC